MTTFIISDYDKNSLSLTTIFTPPSSCSKHWTYEANHYNSVSGGLLLQNALVAPLDTSCFPSGYSKYGRQSMPMLYSPGYCPSGYSTPTRFLNGATTTVVCCQTSFSYYTTSTTVENFLPTSSVLFAGCISTYPESSGATTVLARGSDGLLSSTVVSGPMTMWGQPIEVAFQQRDLPFYTTSTPTPAPLAKASPSTDAQPSAHPAAQAAATAATATSIPRLKVPTSVSSSSKVVSARATAAIGFSLTVMGTFLVALVLFLLWRRRRRARSEEQRMMETLVKFRTHAELKRQYIY